MGAGRMSTDDATQAAQGKRPRPAGRFSSNVRWTLLGTAANSAGTWLLVVILARWSGPAEVGTYAIALALTAPVMAFAGLQMRTLLASDAKRSYTFGEYMRVSLVATGLGMVACIVLAGLVADGGGGWWVLGAVCAMRAADAIAEVYFGLWQQGERMRVIGVGRVIQAAVSIAFVTVACALGAGSSGAALAGALGSATLLVFMHQRTAGDPELRRVLVPTDASWSRLSRLALLGFPLGIIVLLGALQANVPRYFIEMKAGHVALGLFAAASQLTTSGNIFVGALGAAALPRLASTHATGMADFRSLTRRLCLAGAGLGVAGVALSALVGRQVLTLVYRPEFGEADGVLLVLSVAAGLGFVASFLGYALTASRVIAIQPVILMVTLGVMVAFCAVLVPASGAVGAAWALVWGTAVQVIASWMALRWARPVGDEA
jgi:O-antigen/teichoic acid export membrane protein